MKPIVISIYLIMFCFAASAGRPGVVVDGHYWNGLNIDRKIITMGVYMTAFLEGVREGFMGAHSTNPKNERTRNQLLTDNDTDEIVNTFWVVFKPSPNYTPEELVKMADDFYSDYANLDVSLFNAMVYVSARIKGSSEDVLEMILVRIREEAHQN